MCYCECYPQSECLTSYKRLQVKKIDSICNFLSKSKKTGWLHFLPNVRYSYNPIDNKSYVSAGISLQSLSSYFQQKQRNKLELYKLKNSLLDRLDIKMLSLENEYNTIISDIEMLKLEKQDFKLQYKMYSLKKKQYENNKINLESWLKFQLEYKRRLLSLKNKSKSLVRRLDFFNKKINCPNNEIEQFILRY